ncbi:glycine N-acyltransferase-like protein 3-like [Platysternon megacephalum]|uniref:Glycine N-acyltransferase-like protein 3-like n=1 Tax=Platysternon megacephalum TaxID=55544 RepID=A0A4D9DM46_9SAUR|nr:glycine N-acyltransferase-like protein 3-like [Platysternon megacephalum]
MVSHLGWYAAFGNGQGLLLWRKLPTYNPSSMPFCTSKQLPETSWEEAEAKPATWLVLPSPCAVRKRRDARSSRAIKGMEQEFHSRTDQDPKDAKSHQHSLRNQRAFVYQPSSTEHAQGDPPPVAKPAVAPAEKREECDNSEAPSEIRSPRRMQPLAKSTQTEESSPNQTQPPCFPDGRGNKNRFGLEKRNSPPPLAGAGRKWAEGSEVEREEELKELGWINYGFTTEPVYRTLDCPVEEGVKVRTVVTDVSYKDDHCTYCFDYGNRHYYQPKKDHERAYMMKLAESSEKVIQQNLREFFGLLRILVNVVLIFLIELVRFLGKSMFQVLVVGLLTTVGDHILKPFLVAMFNSLLQPLLLFLLNVLCSVRNLTYPLIDILKGICLQLAVVLQAFRLVEVNIQSETPLAQKV